MNLGAQATARAADRLIFRPLFWPRQRAGGLGRWWSRRSDIRSPDHRTRLEDPPPNTLEAPTTEATEYTVPIPERFRQITPGRARTHNPKHAFHEHRVVAPGRAFLVRPAYDQRRYPLPRRVAQNQPFHHTQDCLPKSSLESDLLLKGNP